jgi:hypothetical protein
LHAHEVPAQVVRHDLPQARHDRGVQVERAVLRDEPRARPPRGVESLSCMCPATTQRSGSPGRAGPRSRSEGRGRPNRRPDRARSPCPRCRAAARRARSPVVRGGSAGPGSERPAPPRRSAGRRTRGP